LVTALEKEKAITEKSVLASKVKIEKI